MCCRGYQNINEGFSGTFCSAAELVQDSDRWWNAKENRKDAKLVGGFKDESDFPFNYFHFIYIYIYIWDVILPIDFNSIMFPDG